MPPKFNRRRAVFVLGKIDEILAWERRKDAERDTKFVELARYLCEVRAGQYWRLESLKCFDEFLERRFPESRRKAYYLMSDPRKPATTGEETAEGSGMGEGDRAGQAREAGQAELRLCNLVAQSPADAEGGLQEGGRAGANGAGTEPWEIVYFKLYQSQMPVIERAIETAALMLGSDRSRGYCLEMICEDFLAGANLDNGDPETLLFSMTRFFRFLPGDQRQAFLRGLSEKAS